MTEIIPSVHVFPFDADTIMKTLETAGRTCYKSEHRVTAESAAPFVRARINERHTSVLEHAVITVRFVCDRGVSHELVRHRLASYCQESTRYVNYRGSGIGIIHPAGLTEAQRERRETLYREIEAVYAAEIGEGLKPQLARGVLPTSLKTEVVMTCNLKQWLHVIRQRADAAAHPQIRELMLTLLEELNRRLPVVFSHLYQEIHQCQS